MKFNFVQIPFNFRKSELRQKITQSLLDSDFDFVCFSTKEVLFMEGIDWDIIIPKVLPGTSLCGIRLRSVNGKALTYPPKLPRIDSSLIFFASKRIRESKSLDHILTFEYVSHFRAWSSLELELVNFVDFLFFKDSIHLYEQEHSLIDEYGEAASGNAQLLYSRELGTVTFDSNELSLKKVAASLCQGSPRYLSKGFFARPISFIKKIFLNYKKNNEFLKNYDI